MQGYRTHIKLTEYKLRSRNNRIVPAPRRSLVGGELLVGAIHLLAAGRGRTRPVDWWAVLGLALMAASAVGSTLIIFTLVALAI